MYRRRSGIVSQLKCMYAEHVKNLELKYSSDSDSDSTDDGYDGDSSLPSGYQIKTKLSNNLKKILEIQSDDSDDFNSIFSFWIPPNFHGLKNSERKHYVYSYSNDLHP